MPLQQLIQTKYFIIGNSAGGISAAEAIRQIDRDGSIMVVSDEPYLAYSRPMISEYLAGRCPMENMLYRSVEFYTQKKINTISGTAVRQIDTVNHTATLEDNRIISWQKILLAMGGKPIIPTIKGSLDNGTFTFTSLEDARTISRNLDNISHVCVIGGGLIGVSVSEALIKRNKAVTIIEMKDWILNTILDNEASNMVSQVLQQAGVKIITGRTAQEINRDAAGNISGVILDNSVSIPCQMVIFAMGVKPRIELLSDTGITLNRGIKVNRRMETSTPDVYACGDVAEVYDFVTDSSRVIPIWPNATMGGRIAGLNMAGQNHMFAGTTNMNSLKYFNLSVTSAGIVIPPDKSYETLVKQEDGCYRKIILKNDIICGMIFYGDIEPSGIILHLMQKKIPVTGFKNKLMDKDFGLASLPEVIWRPMIRNITGA